MHYNYAQVLPQILKLCVRFYSAYKLYLCQHVPSCTQLSRQLQAQTSALGHNHRPAAPAWLSQHTASNGPAMAGWIPLAVGNYLCSIAKETDRAAETEPQRKLLCKRQAAKKQQQLRTPTNGTTNERESTTAAVLREPRPNERFLKATPCGMVHTSLMAATL